MDQKKEVIASGADILQAISIFADTIKRNRDLFPKYLLAAFVLEVLAMLARVVFSQIISLVGNVAAWQPLLLVVAIWVMDMIQLGVDVVFYRAVVTNFEYVLTQRLTMRIMNHVSGLGAGFFSSVPASVIKDRINHIDNLTDLIQHSSWSVITHTFQVLVSLVILFLYLPSWWGLIFSSYIVFALGLFIRISYLVIKQQAPYRKERRKLNEEIAETRDRIIDTNSTIVLNSSMPYFLFTLNQKFDEWRDVGIKEMEVGFRHLGIQRNLVLIHGRRGSLMLVILLLSQGEIGIPQLVLVNTIIETLFIGMWEIARFMYMFVHESQSLIRLEELMSIQPEIKAPDNPIALPSGDVLLQMDSVGFTYPKVALGLSSEEALKVSENGHLENICLTIKAGQRIALIGTSGAGKTTLASILLGERRPTKGALLLNGIDVEMLDPVAYIRLVAKVPQGTAIDIYNASLRFNLTMGKDIPEERLIAALKAASLWDIVQEWENGLDEMIGERGRTLSGGQQQRVAIARALANDPQILVLDEATSSLDPATEQSVQAAIELLPKHLTVITIAHRLATVRSSDWIVIMERGKIEAQGTWEYLLQTSERFQTMVSMQNLT